jgi:hypothetical protein
VADSTDNTRTVAGQGLCVQADLFAQLRQLAILRAQTIVVVARSLGQPGALCLLDVGEAAAWLRDFLEHGRPTLWHLGTVVEISVHGLDVGDGTTSAVVVGLPRRRWLWTTAPRSSVDVIDPQTAPRAVTAAVAGAARAVRPRGT